MKRGRILNSSEQVLRGPVIARTRKRGAPVIMPDHARICQSRRRCRDKERLQARVRGVSGNPAASRTPGPDRAAGERRRNVEKRRFRGGATCRCTCSPVDINERTCTRDDCREPGSNTARLRILRVLFLRIRSISRGPSHPLASQPRFTSRLSYGTLCLKS